MDAVIRTGGKQYRVHEGSLVNVATLEAEPGDRLELRDVLLISDGDTITVGSPTVAGAVVFAEVVEHGKAKKVFNFKYKAKVRYRRKRGHRQGYTRLAVKEIRIGDAPSRSSAPASASESETEEGGEGAPTRRRRRTETEE